MKRVLVVLLLSGGLCAGCLWNLSGPSDKSSVAERQLEENIDWTLIQQRFPVNKVISGDTIEVEYPIRGSWQTVKVKLLGVDAPDRLEKIMTEYHGLSAFAMVLVALDEDIDNPELLTLTDRDMLQERIDRIIRDREMPSLRPVRLLDDGWEVRMQIWPYVPLRASVEYNRSTDQRKLNHLYAYVYSGKLMLNRFLIEEGFARVHPTHLFDQRADFEAAEERARRRGIGIWSVE